jgi:hypothetical protein
MMKGPFQTNINRGRIGVTVQAFFAVQNISVTHPSSFYASCTYILVPVS